MAITGAHVLLYSPKAEAVRALLRDALGWSHVDAGDGWLIFALPPAEVGVHPSEGATTHELYLTCDDVEVTVAELRARGVEVRGEPEDLGYGIQTTIVLPGASRSASTSRGTRPRSALPRREAGRAEPPGGSGKIKLRDARSALDSIP